MIRLQLSITSAPQPGEGSSPRWQATAGNAATLALVLSAIATTTTIVLTATALMLQALRLRAARSSQRSEGTAPKPISTRSRGRDASS